VVLEKFKHAERKIRRAKTIGPKAAEFSGRSYSPLLSISWLTAFSCNVISLNPEAFQSCLALFCTATYLLRDFSIREASVFLES
jgi:hypothetical protein